MAAQPGCIIQTKGDGTRRVHDWSYSCVQLFCFHVCTHMYTYPIHEMKHVCQKTVCSLCFSKQYSAFTWQRPENQRTLTLPSCNDNCRMPVMNVFQPNHCRSIGLLFLFMHRLANILSEERSAMCVCVVYNQHCNVSFVSLLPPPPTFHVNSNLFFCSFYFWLLHNSIWGTHATFWACGWCFTLMRLP